MKIPITFSKVRDIYVNGSLNILRKCKPKAFADGVQGVVVHPRVVSL